MISLHNAVARLP